jgi:SP family galactose:H+ symporter-like MFS transporter
MASGDFDTAARSGDERQAPQRDGNRYVYLISVIGAIGGLLWGYDTGVIAGALKPLARTFGLGSFEQELAVSAVLIGTIIGALCAGRLADRFGRKRLLVCVGLLFVLTSVLTAVAPTFWAFMIFRTMQGMGIGAASVVSPMFISEMAPPRARGRLGFLFQFMITVGILLAYVVDWAVIELGGGWRPMFLVGVVPSLALAIGMLFLPDTPRWLGREGRWDEAGEVLDRVAPREAPGEMRGLRRSLDEAERSGIRDLFRGGLKWALTLGVGLSILQQLVGIDAVIYYAPTITGYSGFANGANGSLVGAILVGAVFVFGEIVSLFLADRVGRRTLLLISNGAMFVLLAAFGAMFLTDYQKHGTVLLVLILLYVLAFAIGMGPIFWLFSAEIFPTRLRGYGSSMSATGNWTADLVVSISFLTLVGAIGLTGTFWIYGFFALVSVIFIYRLAPETRAKPLEAIEEYWQHDRSWDSAAESNADNT